MTDGTSGRRTKQILIGLVVVVALVVTLQNTSVVTFRFLFWQVSISQILLIPLVFLVGFAIGLLAYPLIKRRGRREASARN